MTVTCDQAEWPLLSFRLSAPVERDRGEGLLDCIERYVSRGRCAVVLDTRRLQLADYGAARRNLRRQAQWLRDHQSLVASNVVAVALVFDQVSMRLLFNGLLALAPLPAPWSTSPHPLEARRFCLAALARSGLISVPQDHGLAG